MTSQSRFLSIAFLVFLIPAATRLFAQGAPANPVPASSSSATPPHFELAAVHPSPFTNHPSTNFEYGLNGRFIVHQATMLELIRSAWNDWTSDRNRILRGPAWLDFDRFDIDARAPRGASVEDKRLMLRALLSERFGLVVHTDTKLMPAYVLTVAKGGPKLKPAAKSPEASTKPPDGDQTNSGCGWERQAPSTGGAPMNFATCKNVSMAEFATQLSGMAGGTNNYITAAVVNQTGLTGSYDLQLKWTPRAQLIRAGDDGIVLYDALDQQLGLKLEAKPAPLPVLYVDSVNEKPTPNAPGLDKVLAPKPVEIEVATFKPSAPDNRSRGYVPTPDDELMLSQVTIQSLITDAWNISDDMVADAPKWLNQDRWDIVAKLAHDPSTGAVNSVRELSDEQTSEIIKKLLAERFGLKVHLEQRPAEAYTLVAANPHMQKADPDNRTGCHEGPGADGKDPRLTNSALSRLMTCQNMTMAQFGDMLRINASGYIHSPVLDQTGLTGAYDFTIGFSGAGMLRNQPGDSSTGEAVAPNGAVSLFDAVQKQMGVKLVQQKRPVQMLVIDHINQHPTDN